MFSDQLFKQMRRRQSRMRIVRGHLEAFDLEPMFPIPLFEEEILKIEKSCGIEPSCKVEGGQILAGRFEVSEYFGTAWPRCLNRTNRFLDRVSSQIGIRLDRQAFEQFSTTHINSNKIVDNSIGIHIEPCFKNSSITLYFHLKIDRDPQELVQTAIALDGIPYSEEWIKILLKDTVVICFELLFDGRSFIEILPGASTKAQIFGSKGQQLMPYIQRKLSKKVNLLLQESDYIVVKRSRFYSEPILAFAFQKKILDRISALFLFNALGDRVYDFLKNQIHAISDVSIVATAQEFENSRLDNFSIYYTMHDER